MEQTEASEKNQFFRLPGILWLVAVPFGLCLVSATVIVPRSVPYAYLGPPGQMVEQLALKNPTVLRGIFYTAWLLHMLEAVYAVHLARRKNLQSSHIWMWGIETLFYGIFAMKYLLAYEPPAVKQKAA